MDTITQPIKIIGEIEARFYDQRGLGKPEKKINEFILERRENNPRLMDYYKLGKLINVDKHKNVICNAGFNAIVKRLANDLTYTGVINKMILGTGSGTPSAGDTQMFVEAYRNNTASGTDSSNVAYLTAYFSETEVTGTFTEFGNVIDGGSGANTGKLWSHIAGLNWVKTNTVVLVVSCKYTFQSI